MQKRFLHVSTRLTHFKTFWTRLNLDTCCTVELLVQGSTLTRVVVYKTFLYLCRRCHAYYCTCFLYTCSCWPVSFCTKFYCTCVHFNTGALYQNWIAQVSRLTRVLLSKIPLCTCPRWHMFHSTIFYCPRAEVDTCRTVEKFFAYVPMLTSFVRHTFSLETCPRWHVPYWTQFLGTRFSLARCTYPYWGPVPFFVFCFAII